MQTGLEGLVFGMLFEFGGLHASEGVAAKDAGQIGPAHAAPERVADICAVGGVQDLVGFALRLQISFRQNVAERVIGRYGFVVQRRDRQQIDRRVGSFPGSPSEVLRVPRFMDRDGRHVGIEMDRVREGVVVVAAEDAASDDRFTQDAERAERVAPTGSDRFVRGQSPPIVSGVILIQPHLDRREFILGEIVRDRRLGPRSDAMIVDTPVPQNDPVGKADDPTDGVQRLVRLTTLDLLRRERLQVA